jgi:putative tryptophan/tyrosine transport system substrate-binding protein
MSYSWSLDDVVRRVAYYIDRILKGTPAGELPVEQATRFYLTLNLKSARSLGLTLPQAVLLRADEVIE